MPDPQPFEGAPFTAVAFQGTGDLIVALPLDDVMHRMTDAYTRTAAFVSVPVLLYAEDNDEWTVELGLFRVDRVINLTPWSTKLADTEDAGYALGEAKRTRPRLFDRTAGDD